MPGPGFFSAEKPRPAERAANVRDLLTACDLSKDSLVPDQLSDQELFAED